MSNLNVPNKKSSDLVLNFKLNDFDGPLDLLVELIKEKKMDILTLDIAELSYQYLEFVNNNLLVLQIDDISQYLVMASYLTELKTKMLIPMLMSQDELTETELEIDRLRRQLFLYKQYKDIVGEFKSRQAIRTQLIPKVCDDLDEYTSDEIPEAPLPDHVSIDKLVRAWQKIVINIRENMVDKTFLIKVNNIDMDKIQENLIDFINANNKLTDIPLAKFIKMFDESNNDIEYQCAIFISLLVLAKDGFIRIRQESHNSTIYISKNNEKIKDIEHQDIKDMLDSHKKLSKNLEIELKNKVNIKEEVRKLKEKNEKANKNDSSDERQ